MAIKLLVVIEIIPWPNIRDLCKYFLALDLELPSTMNVQGSQTKFTIQTIILCINF